MATQIPPRDPDDPHARILNELANMSLSLCRNLHDRALGAENAEDAAKLATAFHRIARGLRQTLALDLKLHKDRQAIVREDTRQAVAARRTLVSERRAELNARISGVAWDEYEDPDAYEDFVGNLYEVLVEEAERPAFLEEPLETQVARLCVRLGLKPPSEVKIQLDGPSVRRTFGPDSS